MTNESTSNDHTETIEKARRLLTEVTPGGDSFYPGQKITLRVDGYKAVPALFLHTALGQPIVYSLHTGVKRADWHTVSLFTAESTVPDLLAALVALADERDALRARVDQIKSMRVVRDKSSDGDYLHGFEEALSVVLTILSGGA